MGGGVGVITAMRLAARGFSIKNVVSFGAPKVTNGHGCELFARSVPVIRVMMADDPVPMLPTMRAARVPRRPERDAGWSFDESRRRRGCHVDIPC